MSDYALLLGTLSFAVFGVDWLARRTRLRYLGSALLALLAGAILVNLDLLPAPSDNKEVYGSTLAYVAPLSIFYLILQVDLRDLRHAGGTMLVTFGLAAAGVLAGGWLGWRLFLAGRDLTVDPAILSGMLLAGHIGGSANFNAVAVHYDVITAANVFVTVLAVDHVYIAFWIGLSILLPRMLMPRRGAPATGPAGAAEHEDPGTRTGPALSVGGLGLYFAAGFGSLWLSRLMSAEAALHGVTLPVILLITVCGLIVAHLPGFRGFAGYKAFGDYLVCLFLLMIGAFTDLRTLFGQQDLAGLIAGMLGVMLAVHALFVFGVGRALALDWGVLAVGSQASIGGPVSAGALAEAIERRDLVLPGVLVGSLGGAVGTFVGFAVVAFLT